MKTLNYRLMRLIVLTATLTFWAVPPVSAQSEIDVYTAHLREAVEQIIAKDSSFSFSMHKLPSSVDDRFEFGDALKLALAEGEVDTAVNLLKRHRLTIATDTRFVLSVSVYPYQPADANLAAAQAIMSNDIQALRAAMADASFAVNEIVYPSVA